MSKKKIVVLSGIVLVISICLLTKTFGNKEVDIYEVLSSKYYSYLPEEAKDYIKETYEETGEVLLTEKNKKKGEPYLNPEYVSYLISEEIDENGYVPSSVTTDIVFEELGSTSDLPPKYDLRDVNGVSYVTSMKNQKDFPLCWAFAETGALESKILKEGLYTGSKELDLSERQVDYATASIKKAIDIGKNPYYVNNYTERNLGDAGYSILYMNVALNGISPIYESDWKYNYEDVTKKAPIDIWNNEKVSYDIKGMYGINSVENPDETFINNMKSLIMENGAITAEIPVLYNPYVSYEVGTNETPLVNGTTKNYLYYRTKEYPYPNGHEVMIVGWDDNYTHNLCTHSESPYITNASYSTTTGSYSCSTGTLKTINGAWIIKNSYGSDNPEAYFYLAYESHNLAYVSFYDVGIKNWDNVYYAKHGLVGIYEKLDISEKIEEIKFVTQKSNTEATIYLSDDGSDMYQELGKVEIKYPGLYTLDLNSQNIILENKRFNVIIEYPSSNSYSSVDGISVFTSNYEKDIDLIIEDAKIEQSFVYQGLVEEENIVVLNGVSRNLNTNDIISFKVYDINQNDVTSKFNFYRNYSVSNYINTIVGFNNNVSKGNYIVYAYIDNEVYDEFNLMIDNYFENVVGSGTIDDPYIIKTPLQLDMMRSSPNSYYKLGNNIDLQYDTTNPDGLFYNEGKGWEPIQFYANKNGNLDGGFDGNNYKISNLFINRPDEDYVGLFGKISIGSAYNNVYVKNLTLQNADITGRNYVGVISGEINPGNRQRCLTIENVAVNHGNVNGNNYVGGIIGNLYSGTDLTGYCVVDGKNRHTINGLYNSATITANNYTGGIIGILNGVDNNDAPVYLSNLQNNGKITTNNVSSGLIGVVNSKRDNLITISNAINTGKLIGTTNYDLIGEFVQTTTGTLNLNNMYYLGDNAYLSSSAINANNVSKKTVQELKKVTFEEKWLVETIDNIKRIPVLEFVDFDYTKFNQSSITNNGNIYSLISPSYDAAKNITYEVENPTIAEIDEDGNIKKLQAGTTKINILSNYDGFEGCISYTSTEIEYGDVDENGVVDIMDSKLLLQHLNGFEVVSEQGLKNADVNNDGKVNQVDAMLILQYSMNYYPNTLPNNPIVNYILYGDAEENGEVNSFDALNILNYLNGKITLTEQELKNADVNNDGKVNNLDAVLIMSYDVGYYENILPNDPITEYKVLYLDGNYDGAKEEFSNYILCEEEETLEVLTREGYTFKEWNTKSDGSGTSYQEGDTITLENNGVTTLYAQWIKASTEIKYGDVDENGEVDALDAVLIARYLNNMETLSEQGLKNADINNDGKVDNVDNVLIDRFMADWYGNTLPNNPIIEYILYGDVNEDGVVDAKDALLLEKYLQGMDEITKQGLKNADVNNDSKVNKSDSLLIAQFASKWHENTLPDQPITDYIFLGDADEDGEVNSFDALNILNYLNGQITLTEQELKNADVNNDGRINNLDVMLINAFDTGWYEGTLPNDPITEYKVLYLDGNYEGAKEELSNYILCEDEETLEVLAREGYTFKEWNTKSDGSGTSYQEGDTITLENNGVTTLYAQWLNSSNELIFEDEHVDLIFSSQNQTFEIKGAIGGSGDYTYTEENENNWDRDFMFINGTTVTVKANANANIYRYVVKVVDNVTKLEKTKTITINIDPKIVTITYVKGEHVESIGETSKTCELKKLKGCIITLPSITPKNWFETVGWSTSQDGTNHKAVGSEVEITDDVTYFSIVKPYPISVEDENKELTFSSSNQTITITGATGGSGTYTYSEVSETNGSTSTNYLSINDKTITVKENTPSGTYTYVVKALDTVTKAEETKTVTIKVNPKTITVTYVKGNNVQSIGETSKTCSMESSSGCKVTLPTITANNGYEVVGWSATEGGTDAKAVGSEVTVTKDITYYAMAKVSALIFEDENKELIFSGSNQTITINGATGGSGTYTYSEVSEKSGSTNTNYITISDTTITVKANTPSGTYTYVVKALDTVTNASETKTVTIKVNPKTITVTYVKGNNVQSIGETNKTCSMGTSEGCSVTLPTITANTGYKAVGWSTSQDGTDAKAVGTQVVITKDTTYYSVVKASVLTFDDESKELTFSGSSQTFTITGATGGSGTYTYSEVSEKSGSTNTDYITISDTTITVKANTPSGTYTYVVKALDTATNAFETKTVTIKVNPKTITVTYVKGNNVQSIGETSKTCSMGTSEGCSVTLPTITANTGYKVVGWSTSQDGTDVKAVGTQVVITKDTTYYSIVEQLYINTDDYIIETEIISNIIDNTTKSTYIKKFNMSSNYKFKIFNTKTEEISDNDLIGTGYVTKIYLNDVFDKSYINIVSGDITGDGMIKMNDVMKLATYLVDESVMTESYYIKAGDFIKDSNIKMNDVMKLATYALGGEQ